MELFKKMLAEYLIYSFLLTLIFGNLNAGYGAKFPVWLGAVIGLSYPVVSQVEDYRKKKAMETEEEEI